MSPGHIHTARQTPPSARGLWHHNVWCGLHAGGRGLDPLGDGQDSRPRTPRLADGLVHYPRVQVADVDLRKPGQDSGET